MLFPSTSNRLGTYCLQSVCSSGLEDILKKMVFHLGCMRKAAKQQKVDTECFTSNDLGSDRTFRLQFWGDESCMSSKV